MSVASVRHITHSRRVLLAVVLALVLVVSGLVAGWPMKAKPVHASATGEIDMKYGTIKGDVKTAGYEDSIGLQSFQWGVTNPATTTSTGAGTGKAKVSDITLTKVTDLASVPLLKESMTGNHTTPVTISFLHVVGSAGLVRYLQVSLEDAVVTSYAVSSGGDRPSETLTLAFTKITVTQYFYNDSGLQTGTQAVTYDVVLNKIS